MAPAEAEAREVLALVHAAAVMNFFVVTVSSTWQNFTMLVLCGTARTPSARVGRSL